MMVPSFGLRVQCMQRVESGTTYSTVAGTMPLHPLSMAAALRFLRLCLLISAGVTDDQKDTHEGLKLLARHLKGSGTNTMSPTL